MANHPNRSTQPKWTPGPWDCYVHAGTWSVRATYAPDSTHRAGGYGNHKFSSIAPALGGGYACKEANARLIAAAPELYDALRRLIPPDQEVQMIESPEDFHEDWHTALAALAKARGEV